MTFPPLDATVAGHFGQSEVPEVYISPVRKMSPISDSRGLISAFCLVSHNLCVYTERAGLSREEANLRLTDAVKDRE